MESPDDLLTVNELTRKKLLAISADEIRDDDWKNDEVDYVAACNIVTEDVTALIDIAFDWANDEFHEQAYGTDAEYLPVVAWRTLGQLRATQAIQPLLELSNVLDSDGDDWFLEEFPHVFGLIGQPAIEPLQHFMADEDNLDFARSCAADSIWRIAEVDSSLRDRAVEIYTNELEKCRKGSEELYGTLVAKLLDLNAVEFAGVLEKVHSLDLVDTGMCGHWHVVKAELGIEGTGMPMPEFPTNSIYESLSPAMAQRAAEGIFADGELDHDALQQQNDVLSRLFQSTPEFKRLKQEYWQWPSTLLEIAANYCGASFLDISVRDVNEVLFEIFPRKVSTQPESAEQIVDELRHFFEFVGRVFELKQAKTIAKSLTGNAQEQLRSELSDSSNFGIAKSMWVQGDAAGFDMTNESDVAQFMSLYNDSLNANNAGDPSIPLTMTADEKRAFHKKRKKELAKKQAKKKKERRRKS
jgi:hypothetical protein